MEMHIPQDINTVLRVQAENNPEKIFIYASEKKFSYLEVHAMVQNLAGFLSYRSVAADAVVCLLLPRTPELIISFLAASSIAAVPAPVNYLESPQSIKENINSIDPAVIVVDLSLPLENILQFLKEFNGLVIAVNSSAVDTDFIPWKDAVKSVTFLPERQNIVFDSLVYYNFTTGSTGAPKAALCSYADLYWNTMAVVKAFHFIKDDVHLCMFASFSHPHELFCRALYTGASLVLLTAINPKTIVEAINRYKVSCVMGLAVMYQMITAHCSHLNLPTLRIAESGGMFTNPEINNAFFDAFNVPILSVWGSTETTGVALANTPDAYRLDGSMGRECPGYSAKVVDEDGTELPVGEIGELLIAGNGVVCGYGGNHPFPCTDGWYYTGDLAQKDEDGFYYFIERKSGMIKSAGLKVYPLQIELVLLKHSAVAEAAVIGVREQRRGYVPMAFIVSKDQEKLSVDELTAFCRTRLAAYMIPKQWRQVDSLPKIGSGKINKKLLAGELK